MSRVRVLVVVGTRPEAIKLLPLIQAMRGSRRIAPVVVSTGQHRATVASVLGLAGIEPDADLGLGSPQMSLNEVFAGILTGLEQVCRERYGPPDAPADRHFSGPGAYPAACVVHGDTTSAAAAALSAFHLQVPVAHVEAGLRTRSILSPFPEELNRQLITRIAAFHLAPTTPNKENLVLEGVRAEQVFVTGNTGIDALRWASGLGVPYGVARLDDLPDDVRVVVVTAHRRENWGAGLVGIGTGVGQLADANPDVLFVVSLHPNPKVGATLWPLLEGKANVVLLPAMSYAPFARLLARAHLAITDSGGIQEEAPAVGTPVLVTRASTERLEGLVAGTLRLVGTDPARIASQAQRLLDDADAHAAMTGAPNPYGDGRAAVRIVQAFEHVAFGGEPPERFGYGYRRATVLRAAGYEVDMLDATRTAPGRGRVPSWDGAPERGYPDESDVLGETVSALARLLPNPYGEVPSAIRWLLLLETVLVWVATIWLVVLFVRALREKGRRDAEDLPVVVPDGLLWIFLVPALDEEVTIRDSVSRLIGLGLRNSVVVVIDDGSTDATPAILREMAWPSLAVLRRDLPDARRGKAAALNAGWRYVHRDVLGPGGRVYQGWSADRVVVVVVDADGRLHPESIAATAGLFTDPRVGGVQTLVRIYNRRTFLTWCQDVEFAIFGRLYQLGRSPWGTAGMGGNGQFNRLSALDSVADRVGPWRDTLTEDQDLGLRLIGAGWHGRQESRVGVDQQGLNSLRRLLRQRTRWAQGNLQAMRRLGTAMRADIDAAARVDLVFVLFLPIIQLIVSVGLVVTVCAFLFADVPLWGGALWITFLFYGITFGSGLLGLVCRAPRITPEVVIKAALLSLAYALYAWLIVPALVRAVFRQATGRGSWMKTAREAIGEPHG